MNYFSCDDAGCQSPDNYWFSLQMTNLWRSSDFIGSTVFFSSSPVSKANEITASSWIRHLKRKQVTGICHHTEIIHSNMKNFAKFSSFLELSSTTKCIGKLVQVSYFIIIVFILCCNVYFQCFLSSVLRQVIVKVTWSSQPYHNTVQWVAYVRTDRDRELDTCLGYLGWFLTIHCNVDNNRLYSLEYFCLPENVNKVHPSIHTNVKFEAHDSHIHFTHQAIEKLWLIT